MHFQTATLILHFIQHKIFGEGYIKIKLMSLVTYIVTSIILIIFLQLMPHKVKFKAKYTICDRNDICTVKCLFFRSQVLGISSFAGRTSSLVAPFTSLLVSCSLLLRCLIIKTSPPPDNADDTRGRKSEPISETRDISQRLRISALISTPIFDSG